MNFVHTYTKENVVVWSCACDAHLVDDVVCMRLKTSHLDLEQPSLAPRPTTPREKESSAFVRAAFENVLKKKINVYILKLWYMYTYMYCDTLPYTAVPVSGVLLTIFFIRFIL